MVDITQAGCKTGLEIQHHPRKFHLRCSNSTNKIGKRKMQNIQLYTTVEGSIWDSKFIKRLILPVLGPAPYQNLIYAYLNRQCINTYITSFFLPPQSVSCHAAVLLRRVGLCKMPQLGK